MTADLWGVGLQLGGVMGMISDAMYGLVRRNEGNGVIVRGPPGNDILSKAIRFLTGSNPQWVGGDWLSYEDHWLLLAAQVVATEVVMQNFAPGQFAAAADEFVEAPVIYHEPWHPATVEVLRSQGWAPRTSYSPPYVGMTRRTTHRELLEHEASLFGRFLEASRTDFPRRTHATWFQYCAGELAQRVLTWGQPAPVIGPPIFTREELTLARLVEQNIFPKAGAPELAVGAGVRRAIQIADAVGRELPGRAELVQAASEMWGGWRSV